MPPVLLTQTAATTFVRATLKRVNFESLVDDEGKPLTWVVDVPSRHPQGNLVARILAGAWRPSPAGPELSAKELVEVAPLLLGSGAGALGWWRVRRSDLRSSAPVLALQDACRLFALHVALHERAIERAFVLTETSTCVFGRNST